MSAAADPDRDVATIVAERAGVLAFAREHRLAIGRLADAQKLSRTDADTLARRIAVFAVGIATGLHRDGHDPAEVRERMRAIVRERADG